MASRLRTCKRSASIENLSLNLLGSIFYHSSGHFLGYHASE